MPSRSASRRATVATTSAGGSAQTTDRVSFDHGPYLVVAGRRNDTCAAIGYLANKLVEQATAETVDEAIELLIAALDRRTAEERARRVDGTPTAVEYREAFLVLTQKMPKRLKAMLALHCRQPNSAGTLHDLARRFDISEKSAAMDYAKLARGISKLLDFTPDDDALDRKLRPLLSMATLERVTESGHPILRLRPELVEAQRTTQQLEA